MLKQTIWSVVLATLVAVAAGGAPAHAQDAMQPLDRPLPIVVRTHDDRTLEGRLTAFGPTGFALQSRDDETVSVPWSDLPASRVYVIHDRLIPTRDAEAWLRLGRLLRGLDDGAAHAERALKRAEALDPSLSERIARARNGQPDVAPPADEQANTADDPAAGPEQVGAVQAQFWGELTDAQHAEAIVQLDAFAQRGLEQVGVPMRRLETQYFLFYTDLPAPEAAKWARLLDKMYARLCTLFGVDEGANIWRGKCLILVFHDAPDYHRFELEVHGKASAGTAGRCWSYGDGSVHVTFYRQPDEMAFAHVLVHEAVHGFLHRYRSPVHIPSWINEGLADVIAAELVPESRIVADRQRRAATDLRRGFPLGGFFDAAQIDGWQYGLASGLTALMIREHKAGYVAFINGIKDGLPWRQSLATHYGAPLDRLLAAYLAR